jgi:hypothetical protein
LVISVALSLIVCLSGCGGTPTTPPIEEDFINIISVTPNSGLIDGVDTNFKVVVEYNLYSYNQGKLYIGFNIVDIDGQMDGWSIFQNADFFVNKGSGTHEFNVTVKPRNWGSQGDFSVRVGLEEIPWVDNWALASDEEILTFK